MKRITSIYLAFALLVVVTGCSQTDPAEKLPEGSTAMTSTTTTATTAAVDEPTGSTGTAARMTDDPQTRVHQDDKETSESSVINTTAEQTTEEKPNTQTTTTAKLITTTTSKRTTTSTTRRVTTTTTNRVTTATTKKPTSTTRPTASTTAPTGDHGRQVFDLINQERAAVGLAPLSYRSDLQELADIRAGEIKELFSHTRPDGTQWSTVFSEAGIRYRSIGENIASGYTSAKQVMEGWMNSSGHRKNILGDYTGVVVGFNNNHWVQLFIKD